mmetsp:Transcript_20431/g.30219  ORF Transcript_20431/g.30219 Transcript_20431/m.30219 type:complete len:644 (+) Transcript_20431:30-1961(+)
MSDPITYKGIGIQGHNVGIVKFFLDHFVWTSADRQSNDKHDWKEIERASWCIYGKYGHLRMFLKDKSRNPLRLDGFQKNDFENLKEMLAEKQIKLTREKVNCGGGNYGDLKINENLLTFFHGDRTTFDISLNQISQCVLPGNKKGNDVELQFHESDAVDNATEDCLVEMRLYIPDDSEEENSDENDEIRTKHRFTAESFQQTIMDKANLGDVKGNVLCELDMSLGTFLTPRGRYGLELYTNFLRMHGSKYDYKIQYQDIDKLFYLEKPGDNYIAFVISLDKPIRQGQQRYPHLVLQTTKKDEIIKINLTEAEIAEKYSGIEKVMQGPLSNLIARVFKNLSKKPVFITGTYRSATGDKCVKCAMGASEGHLYPLNKSFIFIHKPTKVIGFDEVESIEFQRYSGTQDTSTVRRSFDLCIILKSGYGEPSKEISFSGIDRSEYPSLYQWCQVKNMKIKNIKSSSEGVESALAKALIIDDEDIRTNNLENGEDISSEDADYAPPSASESEPEANSEENSESEQKSSKKRPTEKSSKHSTEANGKDESTKTSKTKKQSSSNPTKKKKQKKDPNAPKGALSAFLYYSIQNRSKVLQEFPSLKLTEVSKVIGERWRALTSEDKKKYEELAAEDKTRYTNEMAAYNKSKET